VLNQQFLVNRCAVAAAAAAAVLACRYCANFTISQLQPLFKNKLINYVQLSVIPWGNARIDSDGKVQSY
jgi:hypothetical protein